MGEKRPEGEELNLARPTMGKARRGWGPRQSPRAADLVPAFAIGATLLTGVVRRPRARRLHLLLLAPGREEESKLIGV